MSSQEKRGTRRKMEIEYTGAGVVATVKLRGAERGNSVIGWLAEQEEVGATTTERLKAQLGCRNCGMDKGHPRNKPKIETVIVGPDNEKMAVRLTCEARSLRRENANCYSTFPPEEPVRLIVRPGNEIPF